MANTDLRQILLQALRLLTSTLQQSDSLKRPEQFSSRNLQHKLAYKIHFTFT